MACFLRYCPLTATGSPIPHVPASCGRPLAPVRRRRDGNRRLGAVPAVASGTDRSCGPGDGADAELRSRLVSLVAATSVPGGHPVGRRSSASTSSTPLPRCARCWWQVSGLAWQATGEHPAIDVLDRLRTVRCRHQEPAGRGHGSAPGLRHGVKPSLTSTVSGRSGYWRWPPLFALRRALRNGSV